MKKMLFALLLAGFGISSNAYGQFSAGTNVLGGSFSYSEGQSEAYSQFSMDVTYERVSISPRFGTFVADNTELGLQVAYIYSAFTGSDEWYNDSSSDMLMLAPYARKYISLNDWAGFYMQGGLGYGWGKIGGEDLSKSNIRTRLFVASVAPGVTIKIGEHVGIDFQANLIEFTSSTTGLKENYSKTKSKPSQNFSIGPDFSSLSLGLNFFFN